MKKKKRAKRGQHSLKPKQKWRAYQKRKKKRAKRGHEGGQEKKSFPTKKEGIYKKKEVDTKKSEGVWRA